MIPMKTQLTIEFSVTVVHYTLASPTRRRQRCGVVFTPTVKSQSEIGDLCSGVERNPNTKPRKKGKKEKRKNVQLHLLIRPPLMNRDIQPLHIPRRLPRALPHNRSALGINIQNTHNAILSLVTENRLPDNSLESVHEAEDAEFD
jgi:hypothetical protein